MPWVTLAHDSDEWRGCYFAYGWFRWDLYFRRGAARRYESYEYRLSAPLNRYGYTSLRAAREV